MPSDAESVVVFKLFAIKLLYKIGQRDGPMIAGRLTTHSRLAEQTLKLCCGDFPISEAVDEVIVHHPDCLHGVELAESATIAPALVEDDRPA